MAPGRRQEPDDGCNMNNCPPSRKTIRSESTNRKLEPWERQAIIDAYEAGEKIEALASEFGVDLSYPRKLASRAGHKLRAIGRPKMGHLANAVVSASFGSAP